MAWVQLQLLFSHGGHLAQAQQLGKLLSHVKKLLAFE